MNDCKACSCKHVFINHAYSFIILCMNWKKKILHTVKTHEVYTHVYDNIECVGFNRWTSMHENDKNYALWKMKIPSYPRVISLCWIRLNVLMYGVYKMYTYIVDWHYVYNNNSNINVYFVYIIHWYAIHSVLGAPSRNWLFVCLFVLSRTSNFSAIWWLSPLLVTGLQI
jgi:hypothetical protein